MTKKHFVFDVDDTLIDSYGFNQQIFIEVFSLYLDVTDTKIEKYLRDLHFQNRGCSMCSQFTKAIRHFSLKTDPQELVKRNEKLQVNNFKKLNIFDAVDELIENLTSQGRQVSICTNRSSRSLLKILENRGIKKYLTKIISCSDMGHEKPDPYCLLELIKESGQPKQEFVYFGDSATDYQFATNAGVDCVIIDYYLNKKFYKLIVESFTTNSKSD
ncbi:HAD family hydrolase [Patescibacteria group bacterium]|nr:HAD family hydrolase [Patescibacteria group bacterium]MBU1931911.1 HAD family hydrolase [Patescibacteria group bacterium]